MSDGKAVEGKDELSRKVPDSRSDLAQEAFSGKGTDTSDKNDDKDRNANRDEHDQLRDVSSEGKNAPEQDWRQRELAQIRKQQEIAALERKAHSSGTTDGTGPLSLKDAASKDPAKESPQAQLDRELAKIKHEQEIANLEKQMHSGAASSGDVIPKVGTQGTAGGSNNSEVEWRQKELERLQKEKQIADQEKAMHSSAPPKPTETTPKPNSNQSEMEWRQKELERLQKEKQIADQEKAMHSSTPPKPAETTPKPNTNQSEMDWRQKELERLQKEKLIAEQEKAMHSSAPPKPAETTPRPNSNQSEMEWRQKELERLQKEKQIAEQEKAMHSSTPPRLAEQATPKPNSNQSEIEWRQKELERLKKESQIAQQEKQMHSSTPTVSRPGNEPAKPAKTEATPGAQARPGEPAKPRPETVAGGNNNKPETAKPRTEGNPSTASNKPELRDRSTPVRENAPTIARRDNQPLVADTRRPEPIKPLNESKKIETAKPAEPAATLARKSEAPVPNQKNLETAKAKPESALLAKDQHAPSIKNLEVDKKQSLNLSQLSKTSAELSTRDNASGKGAMLYAALAKNVEFGKKEITSVKDDAQRAIRCAMLPSPLKQNEQSHPAVKSFETSRSNVIALNSAERFRNATALHAPEQQNRPLSTLINTKASINQASAHDVPRPLNLTPRSQGQIAQIGNSATPGRVGFAPARSPAASESNIANTTRRVVSGSATTDSRPAADIINRAADMINRGVSATGHNENFPIRYVSIAGRIESFGTDLNGIKRSICRTNDGRQMPGVELVMGALLTSAAIAKARRGVHDSERIDDQTSSGKFTWLQALMADKAQKKQKEKDDNEAENDPLIAALEVFNDGLKADREALAHEAQKRSEGAALHQRSSSAPVRPKYEIKENDTLERIAQKQYHDRSVSWLIADINQGKIKESMVDDERVVELFVGQVIELPAPEEAEHYLLELSKRKSRWESAGGRKLITIVTNAGDNADMLQDILGKIV